MSLAIGPTSLDWPAWVQAVGSATAIAISVGVALWLPRLERRRQIQQTRATLLLLAEELGASLRNVADPDLRDRWMFEILPGRFAILRQKLADLDLALLDCEDAIPAVLVLCDVAERAAPFVAPDAQLSIESEQRLEHQRYATLAAWRYLRAVLKRDWSDDAREQTIFGRLEDPGMHTQAFSMMKRAVSRS